MITQGAPRVLAMATDPIRPAPEGVNETDIADWRVLANMLLNLDAVLTRN